MPKFVTYFLLFFVLLSIPNKLFSQKSFDKNYHLLKSKGNIPFDFLENLNKNIDLDEDLSEDFVKGKSDINDLKSSLILRSAIDKNYFFKNGLLLFGDTVTEYLNVIKNQLLIDSPELSKKIKIYTLRTSEINAYCTYDGTIMFSVGLLARMRSEAEIAFIVAHEISHYILKHSLKSIEDIKIIQKLQNNRKSLSFDDILKLKFSWDKNSETQADSLGHLILLKSNYTLDGAIDAMNTLSVSHIPISNIEFDTRFFNNGNFVIPSCFFKESTSEIKAQENMDDEYLTHPDLLKRKAKLNLLMPKNDNKSRKLFIQSEDLFNQIKTACAFEYINSLLVERKYGEAFYTAYILSKKYPDNNYLKNAFGLSLYGLAKYKNFQAFHYASSGYFHLQGYSQSLQYFFKQLSAKQLNIITLKYLINLKNTNPTEAVYYNLLINDLVEDIVIKNQLKLSDFYNEQKALDEYDAKFKNSLTDTSKTNKELRQYYKDFHLLALATEKEDAYLKQLFENTKAKETELIAINNMDYKTRKAYEEDTEKKNLNKYKLKNKRVLVGEPHYYSYNEDKKKSLEATISESKEFEKSFSEMLSGIKMEKKYITANNLNEYKIDEYNNLVVLSRWVQERFNHIPKIDFIPIFTYELNKNNTLSNHDAVCTINILRYNKRNFLYSFKVYDLNKGETVYKNIKKLGSGSNFKSIISELKEDFNQISPN